MLRLSSAEQAVDRDVEFGFGEFARVVVLAELGEDVGCDGVGAGGVVRGQGGEEGLWLWWRSELGWRWVAHSRMVVVGGGTERQEVLGGGRLAHVVDLGLT